MKCNASAGLTALLLLTGILLGCGDRDREERSAVQVAKSTSGSIAGSEGTSASSFGTGWDSVVLSALAVMEGQDTVEGGVVRLNLRMIESAGVGDGAMEVGIFETAPVGAGESLRSSVWQAAMVASMEADVPLLGHRIELHIPGHLDGPSAGLLVALGVISALSEQPFPADLAVTGALNPDGTIAPVTGLPQKLRAASQAGFGRVVIPADIRFDMDLESGKDIDLFVLAESLGMQLLPASTVTEAARLAGLEVELGEVGEADLEIPEALSRTYLRHTRELLGRTEQTRQLMSAAQQEVADKYWWPVVADSATRARNAMRVGKAYVAYSLAMEALVLAESQRRLVAHQDIASLPETPQALERAFNELTQSLDDIYAELATKSSQVSDGSWQMSQVLSTHSMMLIGELTNLAMHDAYLTTLPPQDSEGAVRNSLLEMYSAGERLRVGGELMQQEVDMLRDHFAGGTNPNSGYLSRQLLRQSELTFFSAGAYLEHGFLADQAAAWDMSKERSGAILALHDPHYAFYVNVLYRMRLDNYLDSEEAEGDLAPEVERTHLGISYRLLGNLEGVAGLSVPQFMWDVLRPQFDKQGEFTGFDREAAMSTALRSSRKRAVHAVARAQAAGVDCLTAVQLVQMGDYFRDQPVGMQSLKALASYWRACLTARGMRQLAELAEQMLHHWNARVQRSPNHPDGYCMRGLAQAEMGQWKEALADMDHAIKLAPDRAAFYNLRAMVRRQARDLTGSLEDYTRAIELAPLKADHYLGRAQTRLEMGQRGAAAEDVKQCQRLGGRIPADVRTRIDGNGRPPQSKEGSDVSGGVLPGAPHESHHHGVRAYYFARDLERKRVSRGPNAHRPPPINRTHQGPRSRRFGVAFKAVAAGILATLTGWVWKRRRTGDRSEGEPDDPSSTK